jgi:hypothetical protein
LGLLALIAIGGVVVVYYLGYFPSATSPSTPPPAALPTTPSLPTIQGGQVGPQPVVVIRPTEEGTIEEPEGGAPLPPLPSAIDNFISNPQATSFDPMDRLDPTRWNDPLAKAVVVHGSLILAASAPGEENPWAWLGEQGQYAGGEAALLRMRFDQGTDFEVHMHNGDWDTTSYHRWGLYKLDDQNSPQINAWSGTAKINGNESFEGALEMLPHHWYYWLFAVEESYGYQVVWDPENPDVFWEALVAYEVGWDVADWVLTIQVFEGILHVDEYYKLISDGIRD